MLLKITIKYVDVENINEFPIIFNKREIITEWTSMETNGRWLVVKTHKKGRIESESWAINEIADIKTELIESRGE